MSQENVEIVRRGIESFNRRDMAAIRADAHPQIEWVEDPRYPGAQTFHGPMVWNSPSASGGTHGGSSLNRKTSLIWATGLW